MRVLHSEVLPFLTMQVLYVVPLWKYAHTSKTGRERAESTTGAAAGRTGLAAAALDDEETVARAGEDMRETRIDGGR
jgi:hypothetical protein